MTFQKEFLDLVAKLREKGSQGIFVIAHNPEMQDFEFVHSVNNGLLAGMAETVLRVSNVEMKKFEERLRLAEPKKIGSEVN